MRRSRFFLCTHRTTHALVAGACAAVLTLTGCAAYGTKVDQATLADLVPHQTTCAAIRQRYGPPTSATLSSEGTEQLTYAYSQTQVRATSFIPIVSAFVRGADTEQTSVTFDCDREGRLTAYTSNQGQLGMGTGLISGGRQK